MKNKKLILLSFSFFFLAMMASGCSISTMAQGEKGSEAAPYERIPLEKNFPNLRTEISPNLMEEIPGDFLIGVENEKIYFGNMENSKLSIMKLDIHTEDIQRAEAIYVIEDVLYEIFHEIINGKIYMGYLTSDNFNLIEVSNTGEAKVVYTKQTSSAPAISCCETGIVIQYDREDRSRMEFLSLEDGQVTLIEDTVFDYQENGLINGDWILRCGMLDGEGVYYEVGTYENEMEQDGTINVYYYDFDEGKKSFVMELDQPLRFLTGDMDGNLLVDFYEIENPGLSTGTIYYKQGDAYVPTVIEEIKPAFKIIGAYKINQRYLVCYNPEDFFIFDLEEKTFSVSRYSDYEKEESASEFKTDGKKIYYLKYTPEDTHLVSLELL